MPLRSFQYLDDVLVRQFLAQLEGGTYDEEDLSEKTGGTRGGEISAKAGPLSGRGSRESIAEQEISRRIKQTPESEYDRFEKLLDERNELQWIEVLDDDIFGSLRRGEALSIESDLKVPSLFRLMDMAESAAPFLDLMQSLGESVDAETAAAIGGLGHLQGMMQRLPVVAHASGTPRFKFICPLKRGFLREDIGSIDGDCIVIATVLRRLKPSEKYSVLDEFGFNAMSRDDRRKWVRDTKKDMPDGVVSAPAALVTPVAIYR
ncbi:MAG: hypothetical protein KDC33_12275 [Thermoleophilia bacterium]|nr:hypothetical protein [Thermoleophilia bacterium]